MSAVDKVEQELAALNRINQRLQATTDESLPSVLSSLLPKLIPLSNQAALRNKVVELITEALRRAKLSKCHLNLSVFTGLIQPEQLPFACNFALAFLDALSDLQIIDDINSNSVEPLLSSIDSFALFSSQSNAVLFYLLLHAPHVMVALESVPDKAKQSKLLSIVGDYFLDVVLLQSLPTSNDAVPVTAGLSDKRMTRLLSKKKQFNAMTLKQAKLNVLDIVSKTPLFVSTHWGTLLCLAAQHDAHPDIATKALFSLTKMKEKEHFQQITWLNELFGQAFNIALSRSAVLSLTSKSDRTPCKRETLCGVVEFVTLNLARFSKETAPDNALLAEMLQQLVNTSDNKTLVAFLNFLSSALDHWAVLKEDEAFLQRILLLLEKRVESYTVSVNISQMSAQQHSVATSERTAVFALLQLVFAHKPDILSAHTSFLLSLFTVAEKDELSASTALFMILHDVQDSVQTTQSDATLRAIYPILSRLKTSPKASCRLLYLQWLHRCVGWSCELLVDLVGFTEDSVDIVSNYALRLLREHSALCRKEKTLTASHHWVTTMGALHTLRLSDVSRCSAGAASLLSSAAICCGSLSPAQTLRRDKPLVHGAVFDLDIALCEPIGLQVDGAVSVLLGVSHVLSLCPDHAATALNLYLLSDERWSCADAFVEELAGELDAPENLLLLLHCCKLLWTLTRVVVAFPDNDTQDEMAQVQRKLESVLLQRKEKVVRVAIAKCLAFLCARNPQLDLVAEFAPVVAAIRFADPSDPAVSEESAHWSRSSAVQTLSLFYCVCDDEAARHSVESVFELALPHVRQRVQSESALSVAEVVLAVEWFEALGVVLSRPQCAATALRGEAFPLLQASLDSVHASKSPLLAQALLRCAARLASSSGPSRETALHWLSSADKAYATPRSTVFVMAELQAALAEDPLSILAQCLTAVQQLEGILNQQSVDTAKLCFFAIQVLVLLQCVKIALEFPFVERVLNCALACLRQNDAFLQDVAALTLSRLYAIAQQGKVEPPLSSIAALSRFASHSDWLAHEIAVTVTRKKRPLESSAPSRPADAAQQRGDASRAAVAAQLEAQLRSNANTAAAAAGEGGAVVVDEVLEAAAAIAAAELNSTMQGRGGGGATTGRESADAVENGYGAFTKVCSIARKSKDSAIVMQALQLVQCDPTFGMADTFLLHCEYRHASIVIDEARVPSLLPSLFLAKFDPVGSVRDVMTRVWRRVVVDEQRESSLLQANHAAVLAHLIANMLNPHWREREAACTAIEALLLNKPWAAMKLEMAELLQKGLKLLDDVRESTRKAGTSLTKTLITHVLRAVNLAESPLSDCEETVRMMLPILLDLGLVSPSVEARGFSLGALIKIVDSAQRLLEPFLERLIDVLIESVSALEPQMLNYLQFHTTSMQVGSEEWERARVQLSKSSPMHDALKRCLALVSIERLPAVANVAFSHLQRGVGLATKVAAADALSFLAEKYPVGLGAIAGKSLRALTSIIVERTHLEPTLRKSMLNTVGMLAKVVHPQILEDECIALLARSEDASVCLHTIIQRAGDRIEDASLWTRILALSYVGCSDESAELSAAWGETFAKAMDLSGCGTRSGAVHRAMSILAVSIPRLFLHSSWEKRRQGSRVVKDLLSIVSAAEIERHFSFILCALLWCIPGPVWTGQHVVLDCLAEIVAKRLSHSALDDAEQFSADDTVLVVDAAPSFGIADRVALSVAQLTLSRPEDALDIKHAQELLDSALSAREEGVTKDCALPQWVLHSAALLRVLLRELRRGDAEYRISSAAVLPRLQWSSGSRSTLHALTLLVDTTVEEFDLFPLTRTAAEPAPSASSSASKIVKTNKSAAASFMFGNRYGALPASARGAVKKPTASSATPSSDAARTEPDNPAPSEESPSPSPSEPANDASPASPVPPTSADKQLSVPPAVRMYLFETIANLVGAADIDAAPALRDRISEILCDIQGSFEQEAWSIKKAMVQVATAVGWKRCSDDDTLSAALRISILGTEETKFLKVRLVSLEGLEKILKSPNSGRLSAKQVEDIRRMLRTVSTDTRPQILETVSRLQELMLN